MTGTVRLERKGAIAIVTLDRPERRNAFNEHMWSSLEKVVAALQRDLPWAVVITGAGERAFCAGFDVNPDNPQISGLIGAVEKHDPVPVEALIRRMRNAVDGLVTLPVPVIAAVNGFALGGGCELAMCCHITVASENAFFGQPEINIGAIPGAGGTQNLPRLIGKGPALYYLLTGENITAQDAYRLGLVPELARPDEVMVTALAIA